LLRQAGRALADLRAVTTEHSEAHEQLVNRLGEEGVRELSAASEVIERLAGRMQSGPPGGDDIR
jgi:hypothetical protein